MVLNHVKIGQESNQVERVWQEKSLNVLILRIELHYACTNHFVNLFQDSINGLPLLLLFTHISNCLKSNTLQLKEDSMGEIKVVLAGLYDQFDELFHVWIVAL